MARLSVSGAEGKPSLNRAKSRMVIDAKPSDLGLSRLKLR